MSGRRVLVVGSGASAVQFAASALEKGYAVLMLDVGRRKPPPVNEDESFSRLKQTLPDPIGYFLGRGFASVLLPGDAHEYYGFPPSKDYVFQSVPGYAVASRGFAPLLSFAQGGLAEAWTAGVYPFNDAELAEFPFSYAELRPYYELVARRIGVTGAADDLARFFPVHDGLLEPLALDGHSRRLLADYERQRIYLNEREHCYMGRSRVATLSRDLGERHACAYLGRCLWGCPKGALYTPSDTLVALRRDPRFEYVPGVMVSHLRVDGRRRVVSIVASELETGASREFSADVYALGAGTLATSRIVLATVLRSTGERPRLHGLMDNRQILMPFLNLRMIGRAGDAESYQYHLLALGFAQPEARTYVHAQITTLKTALVHPIVQGLPLDLGSALAVFRRVHTALGVANINLHDTRRPGNYVTLDETGRLVVHYEPAPDEAGRVATARAAVRRVLRRLGCIVPPGMTHVRPMGASVHYTGTLPMSATDEPWTTTPECRSRDFENLLVLDGSTFPFLPAKNLTFTLMANAARIADRVL